MLYWQVLHSTDKLLEKRKRFLRGLVWTPVKHYRLLFLPSGKNPSGLAIWQNHLRIFWPSDRFHHSLDYLPENLTKNASSGIWLKSGHLFRSGQIARSMPIGQNLWGEPDFSGKNSLPCKKEKRKKHYICKVKQWKSYNELQIQIHVWWSQNWFIYSWIVKHLINGLH